MLRLRSVGRWTVLLMMDSELVDALWLFASLSLISFWSESDPEAGAGRPGFVPEWRTFTAKCSVIVRLKNYQSCHCQMSLSDVLTAFVNHNEHVLWQLPIKSQSCYLQPKKKKKKQISRRRAVSDEHADISVVFMWNSFGLQLKLVWLNRWQDFDTVATFPSVCPSCRIS